MLIDAFLRSKILVGIPLRMISPRPLLAQAGQVRARSFPFL